MLVKSKIKKLPEVKIGVFGGSGFYDLLNNSKEYEIKTPYGKPSGKIMVGVLSGKQIAFLPRHGKQHKLPPHKIPCKANLWAFKSLGVEYVISPVTAGSLKSEIKPGSFVVMSDFFDRTKNRDDTFYHGPQTAHFAFDKPYCEYLRGLVAGACKKIKVSVHNKGTVVIIEGPRFSTKAESRFYISQGFDVVNMTHYPEVVLARELGMCYASVALVTDWDVGLEGKRGVKPVTYKEILRVSRQNIENIKKVFQEVVKNIKVDDKRDCGCMKAVEQAVWNQ